MRSRCGGLDGAHRAAPDGRLATQCGFVSQTHRHTADSADVGRPYPFFLAHPLESRLHARRCPGVASRMEMGRHPCAVDQAAGRTFLWSRGDELITDAFPEIAGRPPLARRHRDRRRDRGVARRVPMSFAQLADASAARRPARRSSRRRRCPPGLRPARAEGSTCGQRALATACATGTAAGAAVRLPPACSP